MKKDSWKDWLEGVGIVAIVASLLFVGLQLRQSQKIALAEGYFSILSIRNDLSRSIRADLNTWNKAISGEKLSPDEALIFATLVNQINESRYLEYIATREIAGEDAARPVMHDFAIFMYSNPAAKSVWLAREDYLVNYRKEVNPDGDNLSYWRDAIISDLAILEGKGIPANKVAIVDW